MKATLAFLLIATLSVSLATPAIYQSLAEIDKDPIGNTILSAISLNMKAKVPLDDVSNLLKGIKSDLQKDLQTVDDNYESLSERLQGSIDNGGSLLSSYNTNIKGLENAISSANSDKGSKSNELGNSRDSLRYEETRLQNLEASYQATVPAADAEIQGLNQALASLKNAQGKLQVFSASQPGTTTLLELSSNTQQEMKKVAESVEKVKTTLSKRSNLYLPLVRELVEMSTNVDPAKLQKLAELLQQLNDLLGGALNDVQTQKQQFIDNYNREKEEATTNKQNYETHINQLNDDITALDAQIERDSNQLKAQKDLRDAAQTKLDQDKQALADAEREHDTQQQRYQGLIDLVQKIITHFSENVAAVDQYTQERIQNGF